MLWIIPQDTGKYELSSYGRLPVCATLSPMLISLSHLPFIRGMIKTISDASKNEGFPKAMLDAVRRSGTHFTVRYASAETVEVLKSKRVVVVVNHPYEGEAFAIVAALPNRKQVYLIVNATMMHITKEIDKHLIPVYIQHHIDEGKGKNTQSKILELFHPSTHFSEAEEHKRNIESIANANRKLQRGGLIIIFPNPGERDSVIPWYPGVGHLLKGVNDDKPLYVVNAYIRGTSNWDYLRLFPRIGALLPELTVFFSEPQEVRVLARQPARNITTLLEKHYRAWVKTLK